MRLSKRKASERTERVHQPKAKRKKAPKKKRSQNTEREREKGMSAIQARKQEGERKH